jgi:hypothetical protein
MVAYEFEAHAKDGIIKIPEEYREIAEGTLKIIVLKQEQKPGTSKERQVKLSNMKKLLKQIRDKNIFQSIADPQEWQRTIRDEWK